MLKVINSNHFVLKGTKNRWWHLATITKGIREFILFVDSHTHKSYIEEITGGSLEKIQDDELWEEIFNFVRERNLDAWIKR